MNEELVFNPTRLDISRTNFPVRHFDKGTAYVGRLNTMRPIEVLPGSSYKLGIASLLRFTTPVNPTMDNLMCDVYAYFVANDMLLKRQSFSPSVNDGNHSFAAIMGAQDGYINMPYPDAGLKIPLIGYKAIKFDPADASQVAKARVHVNALSLLDQLGYPITIRKSGVADTSLVNFTKFNCLPLIGYYSVWNEDFREPNLQNRYSLSINLGVARFSSDYKTMCLGKDETGSFGTAYGSLGAPYELDTPPDYIRYCIPNGVCRFHGLYGSLLPFPQRNSDPVFLPLGSLAPVFTGDPHSVGSVALKMVNESGVVPSVPGYYGTSGVLSDGGRVLKGRVDDGASGFVDEIWSGVGSNKVGFQPNNLWTDLSQATSASINTIRVAFQTQKWFEALARGGNSDLDEYISSLFGVVGPIDVESKRPVYLGGHRFPVSISQVNNTGTNTGETGAFSLTNHDGHYVKYHSKTYGMLMFFFAVRHADSFADAPQKFLFKTSKFDFYFPQFANLGEEGYSKNLLAYDVGLDDDILGYQEYASDYRYETNAISGQLRFGNDATWHYANMLEAGQFNLATWLDASWQALNVDRTLKVPGGTAYMHFYYDFFIYGEKFLPLPLNSIPGYVDHH